MQTLTRLSSLLALALLLGACAAPVPEAIREAPPPSLQVAEVRAQPEQFRDSPVRWGGVLIKTDNREDETWLTILSRPLDRSGRPRETQASEGRFIAVVKGFLEPTLYAAGQEITVYGRLQSPVTEQVGAYPYVHPVVQVETTHLWPPRPVVRDYDWPPYWYDPWYPFYPPYWRHPYFW